LEKIASMEMQKILYSVEQCQQSELIWLGFGRAVSGAFSVDF